MQILAIDPDLRRSGFCHMDNGKIIELESITFTQFLGVLFQRPVFYSNCVYAIEDVTKNRATWARGTNQAAARKIAQNVGQVKAVAELMAECIRHYTGQEPILVPLGVGKHVKKDAKLFKKITGWEGQTNEDKRDAWAIADYVHKTALHSNG